MKTILLIVTLSIFLAVSVWFAWQGFTSVDIDIGVHGWIALGLGSFFSLIVGGGLMALVFFSSRHGYDDIDRDV